MFHVKIASCSVVHTCYHEMSLLECLIKSKTKLFSIVVMLTCCLICAEATTVDADTEPDEEKPETPVKKVLLT